MALIPQNDAGDVANANGYVTVAEFKAYHDLRAAAADTYGAADDTEIGYWIVKATDYIDTRFSFKGTRVEDSTTAMPRDNLIDNEGNEVTGLPSALKKATSEYALRAKAAALLEDMPAPEGAAAVKMTREKVDVIESQVEYVVGAGAVMPEYPAADLLLLRAGLIRSSQGKVIR